MPSSPDRFVMREADVSVRVVKLTSAQVERAEAARQKREER